MKIVLVCATVKHWRRRLGLHFMLLLLFRLCVSVRLIQSDRSWYLLLIMLTSLAPSPMARVTALLCLFTSSTTWAFCIGVTRQQMTVLHKQAKSNRTCSSCGSRAWACRESTHSSYLKNLSLPSYNINPLQRQLQAEAAECITSMELLCDMRRGSSSSEEMDVNENL